MYKEDSLPVLTAKYISSWSWHVQSMVWQAIDILSLEHEVGDELLCTPEKG